MVLPSGEEPLSFVFKMLSLGHNPLTSSATSPQAIFEKKKKTEESPQLVPFWWFEVYSQDSHSSPSLCHAHTSIISRCRPVVLPTTVVQATTQNLCGINSCLRLPHEQVQKQQVRTRLFEKCNQLCQTPPRTPVLDSVSGQKSFAHQN